MAAFDMVYESAVPVKYGGFPVLDVPEKACTAASRWFLVKAPIPLSFQASTEILPHFLQKCSVHTSCHRQIALLRYYTAHIKYLSMYKGHINDDTQDRLKAKLVEAILKFRFDR